MKENDAGCNRFKLPLYFFSETMPGVGMQLVQVNYTSGWNSISKLGPFLDFQIMTVLTVSNHRQGRRGKKPALGCCYATNGATPLGPEDAIGRLERTLRAGLRTTPRLFRVWSLCNKGYGRYSN